MEYKIIKSEKDYKAYSKRVWELAQLKPTKKIAEEIELLDLLIDKWEMEHSEIVAMDPIQLLKYLMENKNMQRDDLMNILEIDKSTFSLILSYKRGLSKNVIRKLSGFFKVSQEAFNKHYELIPARDRVLKKEKLKQTKKKNVQRIA